MNPGHLQVGHQPMTGIVTGLSQIRIIIHNALNYRKNDYLGYWEPPKGLDLRQLNVPTIIILLIKTLKNKN